MKLANLGRSIAPRCAISARQQRHFAKVVCVLYDDPMGGYPKSYPRDGKDIPQVTHYPDQYGKPGQTVPSPKGSRDGLTGTLLGSVSGELGIRKFLEDQGHE